MFNKIVGKLKSSPFSYATVFSVLLFVVFMCTEPVLSGAGDRNISEYLMSGDRIEAGFFFISALLVEILRFFNSIRLANWWSVFSVGVTFIGVFIFLWFLNKRLQTQHPLVKILTSLLFDFFLWQLMLRHPVNFTQTASIVGLAGLCVIADVCVSEDKSKKRIFKMMIGSFLMLVAGQIRFSALKIVAAFVLMTLAYLLVFPFSPKDMIKSIVVNIKTKKTILASMMLIVVVIVVSGASHELYKMVYSGLAEYKEATSNRGAICDYSDRYLTYEENAEVYEAAGLTESWIEMVMYFATSDENYFSPEYMQRMIDLQLPSQSSAINILEFYFFDDDVEQLVDEEQQLAVRDLLNTYSWLELFGNEAEFVPEELQETVTSLEMSLRNQMILYALLTVAIIGGFFLFGWKNAILPAVGCTIAFVACNCYLLYGGRFPWRVIASCLLASVVAYYVMCGHPVAEKQIDKPGKNEKVILAGLIILTVVAGTNIVKSQKTVFALPEGKITNQYRADILAYMNNNADTVYLYTDQSGMRFMRAYNMWATHAPDYLDNCFPLSTEFVLGCKDKLAEYGIADLYNNLLDYSYIRVCYSEECTSFMYRYFRDYYDPQVTLARVEECEGRGFFRYARPVIPTEEYEIEIRNYFKKSTRFNSDENVYASYIIHCRLTEEMLSEYDDFYINVKDVETGAIYSYGMALEADLAVTEILCMNDTWNPDNVEISLVGEKTGEKIVQLTELTEEFYESGEQ